MAIVSCEAFRYDLPLAVTLNLGRQTLKSRRGFIIRLADEWDNYGYGEVAPFPGIHTEDVVAALKQYRDIVPNLTECEFSSQLRDLNGAFERWLGQYNLFPSLRYGVEMAMLNLLAAREACSLARLLSAAYPRFLPVNGLIIDGSASDSKAQLPEISAEGLTAVKLKVGRRPLQDDIDAVRKARSILGNNVSLRLDSNRYWDFETAVKFAEATVDCTIEYIEEPLADPSRLPDFHALTKLPIALDESLSGQNPLLMVVPECVQALILKPAVLGGLEKTQAFIRLAERHKIKVVISSVFESGVSLAALANCAAALTGGINPAGLDTYRWLLDDLPVQRFSTSAAQVDVDRVHFQARQLRPDLLRKVNR